MQPPLNFRFSDLFSREYRFFAALIFLAPFLIYGQVYDFGFVWDDTIDGERGHLSHPFIENPTGANFWKNFTRSFYGMYIPITYALWGFLKIFADALGVAANSVFHLTNVLVHAINGLLVFVILRQFVRSNRAVFAGVLVFLLHPIQVESVAWISEFRGLLAGFFTLLALYQHLLGGGRTFAAVFIFFVLAILAKPSAAVLPIFIFAINHFHFHFDIRKNIVRVAPFILVVAAAVFFTLTFQTEGTALNDHTTAYWQRPFAWMNAIAFYIFQIIWPANLGASYAMSPQWMSEQWWFYPLSVLPILFFVWLIFLAKKFPLIILAIIFFVGGFFTTSGLVSFGFQINSLVADRYLYLSMTGVALLLAHFLERQNGKISLVIAASIILIFASLSAFRQIPIWRDAKTLWAHSATTEVRPAYASEASLSNRYNAALVLLEERKLERALSGFRQIIDNSSGAFAKIESRTFHQIGKIMLLQRKFAEAVENLSQSLTLDRENPDAEKDLRTAYFHSGLEAVEEKSLDEALGFFAKATTNYPDDKFSEPFDLLFYNQGAIFSMRKQHEKALMNFEKALTINPKYKDAADAKISVHLDLQQNKEAWLEAQKAKKNGVKIHPALQQKLRTICARENCF